MRKNTKLVNNAKNLSSSDLFDLLFTSDFEKLQNYQVEIYHAQELSEEYQKQIFELFEMNMKNFYEQSSDGYHPDEKRKELFSSLSRYLLVLSSNNLFAFTHFRFDMDYGNRVIYLYELQVNMKQQGQGLGQWIVEQLKNLCQKTQMSKIVLTVHKMNQKAIDFYIKKCQFKIDNTDPSDEDMDYRILSFTI